MNNLKAIAQQKSFQFLDTRETQNNRDKVSMDPAVLFTSNSKNGLGNIYLFEKFGVTTTNTIKFSSQITTHYMEDNSARQDHWAIQPIQYTLSGLIGEVIYTPPKLFTSFVQKYVTDYLKPLGTLSPVFDSYTQSAINTVQAVEASLRRYEQMAVNILNDITKYQNPATRKTNQEIIANKLRELRNARQLVSVYTPYGQYNGLAIQDASLTQNNSKYQSNLEVQFIEWRDVTTQVRDATKEEQAMVIRMMKQQEQQQGNASQQNVSDSILFRKVIREGKGLGEIIYE